METNEDENPYASPSEAITLDVSQETVLRRAKLAWQFPLIGIILFAVFFLSEAWFLFRTSLNMLLLLAFPCCLLAGIGFTGYAVVKAKKYPDTVRQVIAGLVANALMLIFVLVGLGELVSTWILDQD